MGKEKVIIKRDRSLKRRGWNSLNSREGENYWSGDSEYQDTIFWFLIFCLDLTWQTSTCLLIIRSCMMVLYAWSPPCHFSLERTLVHYNSCELWSFWNVLQYESTWFSDSLIKILSTWYVEYSTDRFFMISWSEVNWISSSDPTWKKFQPTERSIAEESDPYYWQGITWKCGNGCNCSSLMCLKSKSAFLWCLDLDSIFFKLVKDSMVDCLGCNIFHFDYGDLKVGLWWSLRTSLSYFLHLMKIKCHWCSRTVQLFWFILYLLGCTLN